MIYIPLSSNASPARSLDLAVDALKLILDEIESQSATVPLSPEQAQKIDAAETRLHLLRAGTVSRKSLSSLCGVFGRRAP